MDSRERISVTMTSWTKRIGNVRKVLESILSQSLQPDMILLNLCIQDFPRMSADFPEDLNDFLVEHSDRLTVYWFLENYKAWKKHLHALDIAGDDDLIVSVDDDHIYPREFLEKMYMSYVHYGRNFPITLNNRFLCMGMYAFNGPGTLYRKRDWGADYKRYLTGKVLNECLDDQFILILFALNCTLIMPEIYSIEKDRDILYNDIYPYTDMHAVSNVLNGTSDEYRDLQRRTIDILCEMFDGEGEKIGGDITPSFYSIIKKCIETNRKRYSHLEGCCPQLRNFFEMYDSDFLKANFTVDKSAAHTENAYVMSSARQFIVTISSWPKRVENLESVIGSILGNTCQPDLVIVNLALDDFGLADYPDAFLAETILPEGLTSMIRDNCGKIMVHWYRDGSVKSWKKYLYVLESANPDDMVVCIDDDYIYSDKFLKRMKDSFELYGGEYPVTVITRNWLQGTLCFSGYATMFTPRQIGLDIGRYLKRGILRKGLEDNFLTTLVLCHGGLIMPAVYNGNADLFLDADFNQGSSNFGNNKFDAKWWEACYDVMNTMNKIVADANPGRKFVWNYFCYDFAQENTLKFLEEKKDKYSTPVLKTVYGSIESHFKDDIGKLSETGLSGLYAKSGLKN